MPFDIGLGELILIGIVALVVIGPKDLPHMFRTVGRATGRMRAMADDFRRTLESAADDAGMADVKNEFNSMSEYARKSSGVDEANQSIKEFENSAKSSAKASADAFDDDWEDPDDHEAIKARSEAIKAEARANALRVQAEQATDEAARKREALGNSLSAKKPAKKTAAKKTTAKTKKTTSKSKKAVTKPKANSSTKSKTTKEKS